MKHVVLPLAGAVVLAMGVMGVANASAPQQGSGGDSIATLHAEALHGTLGTLHGVYNACAARSMSCQYGYVTQRKGSTAPLSTYDPVGIGATELEDAYKLTGAPTSNNTVAIIGAAYFDPSALETSLNTYREQYGIPDCTIASGCLTVTGWKRDRLHPPKGAQQEQAAEEIGLETTLDVEMVSAACPACKIVELQTPWGDGFYHPSNPQRDELSTVHFAKAVQRAVTTYGATSVSMSYGLRMDSTTATGKSAKLLNIKGSGIFASTGDGGYDGYFTDTSAWPEGLTTVIGVGGTVLSESGGKYSEMAWADGGSSCTQYLGHAVGQPKSVAKNCTGGHRATADISAVADNVAVFDGYAPYSGQPYNWVPVAGTSISSPFVAGIAGRAGVPSTIHGPNVLYAAPSTAFTDITTGSNGSSCGTDGISTTKMCHAGTGWDGPTGLGSPKGLKPFAG